LHRFNGAAHIVDRWTATAGGVYFFITMWQDGLGHDDVVGAMGCIAALYCLRTARREETEVGWAWWQAAWHVLSAGTMGLHIAYSH
jgi:hypothetical protein